MVKLFAFMHVPHAVKRLFEPPETGNEAGIARLTLFSRHL